MPQTVEIPGEGIAEFPDSMTPDEIKGVIDRKHFANTPSLPTQVVQPKLGLADMLFDPETAQNLRGGIQDIVSSIPGMAAQIPKMAYQGLKFATGGPQERARIGMEAAAEAVAQGRQMAADIQAPLGSRESFRGLGNLALLAAPAAGEVMGEAALLGRTKSKPPIQAEIKPTGGEINAEQISEPAQVHGDVQYAPGPEESVGQVPATVGGEGVPPRGQGEIVQGQEAVEPAVPQPEQPAPVPEAEAPATATTLPKEEPIIPVPEVAREQSKLTSTKNEVVDAERTARGLQPIVSEVSQAHPEIMEKAAAKLTENPNYGKVVVDDLLNGSKKEISTLDEAVLLREKIATQNAKRSAAQRALDESLSEPERVQARQEFEDLEAHNNNIEQATYRSGKIWGEFGRFRQRLAAEDYSLAGAEQRLRLAKGSEPLTLEESISIEKQTEKMSDLQSKIDARRERLERSVAQRKGLEPKPARQKTEIPADTEIEALQTELSTLKSQQAEAERLPESKARTQKRIDEINQRIKDYGFAKPTRKEPVVQDKELVDLQYQYAKAKEVLDRGVFDAQMRNQSLPQKIFRTAGEVLSLPRALKASMDLSAVRRQGGMIFMAHPIRALKNFPPMLKAARSEKGYFEVMQEIRDRPNAPLYRQSKLSLTDVDPTAGLSQMEEAYMSRWANAIPLVNHSQRAYVAFLNHLRADSFDAMANSLGRGGKITADQANVLSNFINVFTGRGAMTGKYADAAAAMNQAFFAPRYAISRFQALIGQPLFKGDIAVKKVIAKEYAKTLIGYGVMYGLIAMAAENAVEFDPRSSDFGKIKFGNTRLDPLSGLSQATVVTSRLLSGRTKSESGEIRKIYGEVPYGKSTAVDVGTRFLRSKLAPVPSSVVNYLQGQDFVGKPVTLPSAAMDLITPLSGSDIVDAMKEQGIPRGAALGTLAFFGDGLQTYSPRVSKKQEIKQ